MTERRDFSLPFRLPTIPNQEGALRLNSTTGRGRIDTPAAYRSMADLFHAMGRIADPVMDDEYNDRFIPFIQQFIDLRVGDPVRRNIFSLERATSWPQIFPSKDTTSIVGKLDNQTVILRHDTEPTNLVLLNEPIQSGTWNIGHAQDTVSGKEKTIRTGFDKIGGELAAIHALVDLGYPVPQNATSHQFFLPWIDTMTYDWIPGRNLYSVFTELALNNQLDQAKSIAKVFGRHLKQVWEPLLEGTLPNGSVYSFPDNVFWNFIYTEKPSPQEAFARIDVGELSENSDPIGSDNYLETIERELTLIGEDILREAPVIGDPSESLLQSIRQGFTEE